MSEGDSWQYKYKFEGLNPAIADGTGKKYWMGYGDPYGFGVTASY